jgi:hypothetical protein
MARVEVQIEAATPRLCSLEGRLGEEASRLSPACIEISASEWQPEIGPRNRQWHLHLL